jgi:hypothetical protein
MVRLGRDHDASEGEQPEKACKRNGDQEGIYSTVLGNHFPSQLGVTVSVSMVVSQRITVTVVVMDD